MKEREVRREKEAVVVVISCSCRVADKIRQRRYLRVNLRDIRGS